VRRRRAGDIDYPIFRHPKSKEEEHKQNPGHKTYCTADQQHALSANFTELKNRSSMN
jgi:hypothetical protein